MITKEHQKALARWYGDSGEHYGHSDDDLHQYTDIGKLLVVCTDITPTIRAAIGMWGYMASDYHGTPLATVPDKLRELLAILEGES